MGAHRPLASDPYWYRDAVIYELRVRSFYDSNGDGIGDLAGLTEKLDYLADLGVTALWLLPFYPSPLRDDGYDISNYDDVHPDVGSRGDFRRFLAAAHARGLRVVTELVLNHTSDRHRWFQRARRAGRHTASRRRYLWSESADRLAGTRVIFRDFETSNWSWDPVAGAYYFHRFYAHQPDLNYDEPAVERDILRVVDRWLALGVDGLRLDAIPYLYKREGTTSENLPEVHSFLRRLRHHVDSRFRERMLLAEANQWPEDAAAYFGAGDEVHMAFHFPLMPRLFLALRQEDRTPLVDLLEQTPTIPEACQWAIFLRNHDELTLEMVSDEERDLLVRAYAADARARLNLGIRRRLAPLVGNDRRRLEILNALLLSLPGTPVLYYGDEIGMGDNIYLGDRNGVRTPMQWSADRNAGFSRANPQQLVLPVITDPEYHYETVNVATQQSNPHSLLWWTKRMLALRRRYRAFGRGRFELLAPENPHILAYVREHGDERLLLAHNLSRFTQPFELDLSRYAGLEAHELLGRVPFPLIAATPYPLTLGPHGYVWLRLEPPRSAAISSSPAPPGWPALRAPAFEELLPDLVSAAGLDRPRTCHLLRSVVLPGGTVLAAIASEQATADHILVALAEADAHLVDAAASTALPATLHAWAHAGAPPLDGWRLRVDGDLPPLGAEAPRLERPGVWRLDATQNLRLARRLEPAPSFVDELLLRLARRPELLVACPVARILAPLPTGEVTLATYLRLPAQRQALALRESVDAYLESALAAPGAPPLGGLGDTLQLVGRMLAELHAALSGDDVAWCPEPFDPPYQRGLLQTVRTEVRHGFQALRAARLLGREELRQAAAVEDALLRRTVTTLRQRLGGVRLRLLGPLSFSLLARASGRLCLLDVDDAPHILASERRIKRSPLRDLATLVCSGGELAHAALPGYGGRSRARSEDAAALAPAALRWWTAARIALVQGYRASVDPAWLPDDERWLQGFLDILIAAEAGRRLQRCRESGAAWRAHLAMLAALAAPDLV